MSTQQSFAQLIRSTVRDLDLLVQLRETQLHPSMERVYDCLGVQQGSPMGQLVLAELEQLHVQINRDVNNKNKADHEFNTVCAVAGEMGLLNYIRDFEGTSFLSPSQEIANLVRNPMIRESGIHPVALGVHLQELRERLRQIG